MLHDSKQNYYEFFHEVTSMRQLLENAKSFPRFPPLICLEFHDDFTPMPMLQKQSQESPGLQQPDGHGYTQ